MKKIVTALVLSTLSFAAAADVCRGSNCPIAGSSAAASMVAGTMAIRGNIAIRDIEKRFTQTLLRVSASNKIGQNLVTDEMINKVRPGDKVIITYSQSNHLNVAAQEVIQLDQAIGEINGQMSEVARQAKAIEQGQTFGFHNPASMKAEHNQLSRQFQALKSQRDALSSAKASAMKKFSITRTPVTKVIIDANDNVLAGELKAMLSSGKSIYAVQRVPGSIMRKIGSVSRNGWVLAATAVALGLVTAEEISSGKISTRLDHELQQMRKKN